MQGTGEELDALIGGLRQEAARRRAAPDFPIDEEARLGVAMDRDGPLGPRTDLKAVAADLAEAARRLSAATPADPPGRSRRRRRAQTDDSERFGRWAADVAEVADMAASLARSTSARLEAMERRLGRMEAPAGGPGMGAVEAGSGRGDPRGADSRWAGPGSPSRWEGRLAAVARLAADMAIGPGGTALVAGAAPGRWLERIRPSLPAAYSLDTGAAAFADEDLVRSGSVFEHLLTVGDRALALAVLVGPLPATEAPRLGLWAAELARVTEVLVVVSEAPWAWRRRVGDASADQAGDRPVSVETWMDVLHGAGLEAGARYAPGGADYFLVARRGAVGT